MKYGKFADGHFLLRFEKGEDLQGVLKAFCIKEHIQNAVIHGLGSIENPTLAHYFVDTKKYSEKELKGVFEITNLTGTVGVSENQPLVHLHSTLSDENMDAFAGHLVRGTVSATLEVVIQTFPTGFQKLYSEEIGLKLFDLPDTLKS
jgi:predicted DNA-binding protein with PD1-like motif